MNEALLSSEKHDWETPGWLVREIKEKIGPIALDPATGPANPVGAQDFFTVQDNALSILWAPYGLIYCNPPYGRAVSTWTQKFVDEAERGCSILALLPARTDTKWWQDHVSTASGICFLRGRLTFRGAPHAAPFPSALVYWGEPHLRRFYRACSTLGWCV